MAAFRGARSVRRALGRLGRDDQGGDEVEDLALQAVRLERRLELTRNELRRRGLAEQRVNEAAVRLDYEGAPIRVVASAYKRKGTAAKEPFTVRWLEERVRDARVFYDIGANIGGYSLIAAAIGRPELTVVAFEPSYLSFAALCNNVVLNDFADRILPLSVTLGAETGLGRFRHRRLRTAAALHDSRRVDDVGWQPAYDQPVLVFRLDDLVREFGLPLPEHVKLDVDGAELEVLQGAEQVLGSSTLQTLIVEISHEAGDPVSALLRDHGFAREAFHPSRLEGLGYGVFSRGIFTRS